MAWDDVWEKIFSTQNWGKYPGEDLIRFIARNFYQVANRKAVKILEVGCGPGANLWFMAREGFSVYGIDGSKKAIELAQEWLDIECRDGLGEVITHPINGWLDGCEPSQRRPRVIVGDICKMPFDDCFFDAIVDNEAIYCNSFKDSQAIYEEISRVCKHNGKLFSRTFATGCWGDKTGQSVGHNAWLVSEGPMLGKGYTRFTDLDEITDLVRGFNVTGVEMLTRTVDNREHEIKEWIILGEKKDFV